MASSSKPLALIVGVGDGLSASLARLFYEKGYRLALASRNPSKFQSLTEQTNATSFACDVSQIQDVKSLFDDKLKNEEISVTIFNPSKRVRGKITEVDPEDVKKAIDITGFGSFLIGQKAASNMIQHGKGGTILFTGASAGIKGFPYSAAFAMGNFAQRGLTQSMARELHPQNIHICWISIDGPIRNPGVVEPSDKPDSFLNPDDIAKTYYNVVQQHRSAWTSEIVVRPWVERW